jgi:V8-like Glu-specific endopeptidase
MPHPRSPRGALPRLGFAAAIFSALILPRTALAEWKDMNADVNATNFIVNDDCTGTLISLKYRLVLTANHCIDEFVSIEEKDETGADGEVEKVKREVFKDVPLSQKSYQGFRNVGSSNYLSVIAAHKKTFDLALLQIRAEAIPQTVWSHVLPEGKTVTRGDRVFAVGNPLGLDATITSGIISSTTRMIKVSWNDGADLPFFQTDAAINPGSSGGALYNDDGELIGVPAAGARGATGVGLAIPYTLIQEFLSDNCYEDVWSVKPEAKTHDQCLADRRDLENKRREKAGLPPLKDAAPQSSSGAAALAPMRTLDWKGDAAELCAPNAGAIAWLACRAR